MSPGDIDAGLPQKERVVVRGGFVRYAALDDLPPLWVSVTDIECVDAGTWRVTSHAAYPASEAHFQCISSLHCLRSLQ